MKITEKTKKKGNVDKKKSMMKEIMGLGGDKTDWDLIQDVLSESEVEGHSHFQKPKLEKKKFDENAIHSLASDVNNFMNNLDFSAFQQGLFSESESEEAKEEEEEEEKASSKIHSAVSVLVRDKDRDNKNTNSVKNKKNFEALANDVNLPLIKPSSEFIFHSNSTYWYENFETEPANLLPNRKSLAKPLIDKFHKHAELLWKSDVALFEKKKGMASKANKDFVATIMKNGTVTDKVSALTLSIQESPVHTLSAFSDQLINGMAKKKSRREALLAIDSTKDLLLNTILPDRKLKYFVDQSSLSENTPQSTLIGWYFEDCLKNAYFSFIQILENLSKDPLAYVKSRVVTTIFDLLCAKPEQENNLLSLLVNTIGDLDRTIASKAVFLLTQLLEKHPVMKQIVISEVERFLLRPKMSARARYYAVTFLNQIVLNRAASEVQVANSLIHLYFTIFEGLVKQLKAEKGVKQKPSLKKDRTKSKKDNKSTEKNSTVQVDSLNSKMMAVLLTGVNRAFPFAKLDAKVFEQHMDTLFLISHISTFNTSVQALTLIFQVQSEFKALSDRFYRALYESLLDKRLFEASKQALYLNLIYKALKGDDLISRVKAFIKRLSQALSFAQIPLICGSLFLIGELFNQRPELLEMISEENIAFDPDCQYDGKKREPNFANAGKTLFWEMIPFVNHFHPTVSLYAKTIISGQPLTVPDNAVNYDPLLNHTFARFLDRFVFKAPKTVKSTHKGTSLMQPRGRSNQLLAGGRKKPNAILEGEDGEIGAMLDDAPVNTRQWASEEQVPADELFYFQYFKDKAMKPVSDKNDDLCSIASGSEIGDDAWDEAIAHSGEFDGDMLDEDLDDELDFETLGEEKEQEELDSETLENEQSDFDLDGVESDGDKGSENSDLEMEEWANQTPSSGASKKEMEEDSEIDGDAFTQLFDEDSSGIEDDEEQEHGDDEKSKSKIPKKLMKLSSIASKLGYKGEFFKSKTAIGEFASADDFAELLELNDEENEESHRETNETSSKKRKISKPLYLKGKRSRKI